MVNACSIVAHEFVVRIIHRMIERHKEHTDCVVVGNVLEEDVLLGVHWVI